MSSAGVAASAASVGGGGTAASSSSSAAVGTVSASHAEFFAAHLTLQPSQLVHLSCAGNFSSPRAQEIITVSGGGQWLALVRPHETTGQLQTICQTNVFGCIRSIAPFRLLGGQTDYLCVGSDSGRLVILQYNVQSNTFTKVHEETYGKSSVRRIIPGEYLAVDPKGRAVMIAAVEKQKLVYILNRDQATNLTISSPLEAHKSNMLTYSIAALDVVMLNPLFAALEVDYIDPPTREEEQLAAAQAPNPDRVPPLVHKFLTFYELDLSLNHVTRKYNQQIDHGANLLIPVPGGESGPGGVLICCENCIYYKHHENTNAQQQRFLRASFPRRFGFDTNEKGVLITTYATHVQKGLFFFLLQTEHGDLYKVSLISEEDHVSEIIVKYFDTIPTSTSMVVLKTGFLYNASESGNQYLWQFQGIGEEDDAQPFTSSKNVDEGVTIFKPRIPTNLALIEEAEVEVAAPLIDMRVADLAREYTPQIYTLVGRGARSTLRVLRHGLAVSEMAVSELPGNPNAVWSIKKSLTDAFMSYIVVSFMNATIVLSIGETVVEVKDTGILETTNTLHVSLLADGSILQIHPAGIRHIRSDKPIQEWKTPGKKAIQCCAANERQILIALSGGEIVYFELDRTSGNIVDVQRKDMANDVATLAIAPIPEGRQRAQFACVGLYNNTVRILSLESTQTLNQLSMQALPAQPSSIQLVSMTPHTAQSQAPNLYLYIGLANGIMMRSMMDESSGSLSDTRKRFLGTRPVRLHRIVLREKSAVVALSSRAWLSYIHQHRFQMVPLSYDTLEYVSHFSSEQCPEGLVCISANTLRIITIDKIGNMFNQTILPLKNTPRKMLVHPVTNSIVLIETDHNAYTEKQKKELQKAMEQLENSTSASASGGNNMDEEMEIDEGPVAGASAAPAGAPSLDPATTPNEVFIGSPHAGEGAWSSSIRIVDPIRLETVFLLSLEENEAAFSECIMQFGNDPDWYLVIGTAQNLILTPKRYTNAFIHVYKFTAQNTQLQFLHKTQISDIPLALSAFHKKLAVGAGPFLRLYELGKKKLLRKCENKNFPSSIQSITVSHDRLYVGDLTESFHFCLYKKSQNEIEIIADQTVPRYLTSQALLDYDTIAGSDKFGNIFITRLPEHISSQYLSGNTNAQQNDQTLATLMNKYGKSLQGASHKLYDIANFYVGETVMSLQKTALVPGSPDVLIYGTLMGGIGVLIPFTTREDVEFFTHLEMHLRQDQQTSSLCGRDHLAYRSYYFPVQNVVDADLCELFNTRLDATRQGAIAEELVCTAAEVAKRLEDLRNRVM